MEISGHPQKGSGLFYGKKGDFMKKKIILFTLISLVAFQAKSMTGTGEEGASAGTILNLTSPELVTVDATVSRVMDLDQSQLLNLLQKAVDQVPNLGLAQILDVIKTSTDATDALELATAAAPLSLVFLDKIRDSANKNIAPLALAATKLLVERAKEHFNNKNYAQAAALIAPVISLQPLLYNFNLNFDVYKNLKALALVAEDLNTSLELLLPEETLRGIAKVIEPALALTMLLGYQGEGPVKAPGTEGSTHPWPETDTLNLGGKNKKVQLPRPVPAPDLVGIDDGPLLRDSSGNMDK